MKTLEHKFITPEIKTHLQDVFKSNKTTMDELYKKNSPNRVHASLREKITGILFLDFNLSRQNIVKLTGMSYGRVCEHIVIYKNNVLPPQEKTLKTEPTKQKDSNIIEELLIKEYAKLTERLEHINALLKHYR